MISKGSIKQRLDPFIEGKEPPIIEEQGESVKVIFRKRELDRAFRAFVADESRLGHLLSLDHLLILQYLLRHNEVDSITSARICQRQQTEAREILSAMERERGYLERGGTGRGAYWTLHTEIYRRLSDSSYRERDRRIDWEAAKTRIVSILIERARRGEPGLSNEEIRRITHYSRANVKRLMTELKTEGVVSLQKAGRYSKWFHKGL